VLPIGRRYENSRTGGWLEIVSREEGRTMSFERELAPSTGHADPHLHQDFTQTWEALEGEGLIEVGGEKRQFAAGDRFELDPGVTHRDPWLPGEGTLKLRGTFGPCPPFIEAYAEGLAHHLSTGSANEQDEMPLAQIFLLIREYDGRSYRAGIPVGLQRAGLAPMAALARLRGFKSSFPDVAAG
jgi:mannose-6-phosphate isomerase-like protein (cupin superfamily)